MMILVRYLGMRASFAKVDICPRCRRSFSLSSTLLAGHNKWSKIKFDKAVADGQKTKIRAEFSKLLTLYSRLYGSDPTSNPQLAATLVAAKKAGTPKTVIDSAIARGQGRSTAGAVLESLTIEAMVPPSVAVIVEIETEHKKQTLAGVALMFKKAGGSLTTSKFFFARVGRTVFEKNANGIGLEQIMDDAIEAGAEDFQDDEEGNMIVLSPPNLTVQIRQAVGDKFRLKVLSSEIIWVPNEDTKTVVDSSKELSTFAKLVAQLKENPEVQAVYSNASRGKVKDEEWAAIEETIAA